MAAMLSVDEALERVLGHARLSAPVRRAATDALGLVLAEDIASDIDSPPHDKSQVDGYAVLAADLTDGAAELNILEEVTAGAMPKLPLSRGAATRIMTGAPIPAGADAIVMVERTQLIATPGEGWPPGSIGRVRLSGTAVAGQNIMRRATSMRCGQTVLAAGYLIRSIEIGVLAEVGRTEVQVIERPTLAVISTGNELVNASEMPSTGQIRNSNAPLLVAAGTAAGARATDLGIARDEPRMLSETIARGLESDVLVISGGVSAGVLDLVPGVLAELGVEQVFHKVHLKPGKPLWFGVWKPGKRPTAASAKTNGQTLVFGLPGNPVSSFVSFELFVRPAIGKLAGRTDGALQGVSGRLTADFIHRSDRPTYHPARLTRADGQWLVEPLAWKGSGDLRTLVEASALAVFEPGRRVYQAGDSILALRLSL